MEQEIDTRESSNNEQHYLEIFSKKLALLKSDVLDSRKDKLETPKDMSKYLKWILDIAKSVIKAQSESTWDKYEWLEDTVFKEIESIDTNMLTLVLLRNYVANIADIIWYDYQIMEEKGHIIDEFGRTSHQKADGVIDLNVRGDYTDSYRKLYQNQKWNLKRIYDYSFIEEKEMAAKLKREVSVQSINEIVAELSKNNILKKSDNFESSKAPLFVIFEEEHSSSSIKRTNFESILSIAGNIDFLGTEGKKWELTWEEASSLGVGFRQRMKDDFKLRSIYVNLWLDGDLFPTSAFAIETLLSEMFRVIGVDVESQEGLQLGSISDQNLLWWPKNEINLMNIKEHLAVAFGQTETDFEKIGIDYRNNVFVKNLVDYIINNPEKYKKWIVGFVGWALHTWGMCSLLEELWFRTLTVTSKKFDDVYKK